MEENSKGEKEKMTKVFEVEGNRFCTSSTLSSTIVTLVEKISFTLWFRRCRSIPTRKERRGKRCFWWLTPMLLETLRVSTRDGRV